MGHTGNKRNFVALIVMALLLAVAMPATSFGKDRGRRHGRNRFDNRDWKCGRFVNCHDARDGRWDGRGPRRDRLSRWSWRNNRRDDDRWDDRRRRNNRWQDNDWRDGRWWNSGSRDNRWRDISWRDRFNRRHDRFSDRFDRRSRWVRSH